VKEKSKIYTDLQYCATLVYDQKALLFRTAGLYLKTKDLYPELNPVEVHVIKIHNQIQTQKRPNPNHFLKYTGNIRPYGLQCIK
jgi:hypothetical protein